MKTARRIFTALLVGAGLILASGPLATAAEMTYNADLVNDDCIATDTNYDLSLYHIDNVSFVASYSTTTQSAKTFTDGKKSTATITVNTNTVLSAAKATVNISVMSASSTTLRGHSVTLNGKRFQAGPGGEWTAVATATGNAAALAAAINAHADFDAAAVSTVVYATCTVAGFYANSYAVTTSSSPLFILSAAAFTGGLDNARIGVNGVVFDAGTDFTVGSTSSATAKSISDAIMADTTLAAVITSTWTSGGIVAATSNVVGVNAWVISTSTNAAIRLNGSATLRDSTFLNGEESKAAYLTDIITIASHAFGTGTEVLYTTTTGKGITGLTNGVTYYVIKTDASRIQLASSEANAVAGTAVDISSTQTGGGTYTLTPVTRDGNPAFKWQAANNSTTFVDLVVSSVTITSASSAIWDFGTIPYRTLRLKYTAPTTGCAQIRATGTGRKQ